MLQPLAPFPMATATTGKPTNSSKPTTTVPTPSTPMILPIGFPYSQQPFLPKLAPPAPLKKVQPPKREPIQHDVEQMDDAEMDDDLLNEDDVVNGGGKQRKNGKSAKSRIARHPYSNVQEKRLAHSVMEKQYREELNRCIAILKDIVPLNKTFKGTLNKVATLRHTVDYIQALQAGKITVAGTVVPGNAPKQIVSPSMMSALDLQTVKPDLLTLSTSSASTTASSITNAASTPSSHTNSKPSFIKKTTQCTTTSLLTPSQSLAGSSESLNKSKSELQLQFKLFVSDELFSSSSDSLASHETIVNSEIASLEQDFPTVSSDPVWYEAAVKHTQERRVTLWKEVGLGLKEQGEAGKSVMWGSGECLVDDSLSL